MQHKKIALVKCKGTCSNSQTNMIITVLWIVMMCSYSGGGAKACSYGCLGLEAVKGLSF